MAPARVPTEDPIEETITAWRRERPGLDLSGVALLARLERVAHRLEEAQDEFFAALGLKPGWLDVLAALRRAGEPYRLTPTRLALDALISTAGMTNRLDRLEEAGLVRRRPDPDDRRGILVELTAKGRELVDAAVDAHRGLSKRLLGGLDGSEREQLDRLLRKLLTPLDQAEQEEASSPARARRPEPAAPARLFPTGRVAPRRRRA
jgi:DNA-binding MarR family transcriptional regulator